MKFNECRQPEHRSIFLLCPAGVGLGGVFHQARLCSVFDFVTMLLLQCHIEKGVEHSVNLGIMDVAENCGDYLSEVLDLQVILCELLIPVQTKRATLQHLQSKNAQFAYPLARFPPFM